MSPGLRRNAPATSEAQRQRLLRLGSWEGGVLVRMVANHMEASGFDTRRPPCYASSRTRATGISSRCHGKDGWDGKAVGLTFSIKAGLPPSYAVFLFILLITHIQHTPPSAHALFTVHHQHAFPAQAFSPHLQLTNSSHSCIWSRTLQERHLQHTLSSALHSSKAVFSAVCYLLLQSSHNTFIYSYTRHKATLANPSICQFSYHKLPLAQTDSVRHLLAQPLSWRPKIPLSRSRAS